MATNKNVLADDVQLATTLRRGLIRLNRRLRAERPDDSASLTQLQLLGRLYRDGSCIASELAEREHLQPQSLTRLLAAMEREGWIVRTQSETDRRQFAIAITAAGKALVVRDMKARDAWLARSIAANLGAEDKEILLRAATLMERLSDLA